MCQLVLCTCPTTELAEKIATALVTEKLVACVNILPQITSVYQWQGKIEKDSEVQLLIKTTAALFSSVNQRIRELHSYDVPEVIAVDIQQGDSEYLDWITNSLK